MLADYGAVSLSFKISDTALDPAGVCDRGRGRNDANQIPLLEALRFERFHGSPEK